MQDFSKGYQQWLFNLSDALHHAKQHQVERLFTFSETVRAYMKAGSDLTAYETALFIETFKRQAKQDELPSLWPEALWYELSQVTDKTQLEWQELSSDFAHQGHYQAGEEVGMGLYCCDACQATIPYYHPAALAVCPACGGTLFHRQGLPV
jgi:rubrerythrin